MNATASTPERAQPASRPASPNSRAIRLPGVLSLQDGQRLLEFLNGTARGQAYRLVLDEEGMALENGAVVRAAR